MKKTPYTYTTKYGEKSVDAYTMFDINKTIMRCLTKNLAMFGLGIYIYAGEDLPEGYEAPAPKKPTLDKARFNGALDSIKNGNYSIEKLQETFELSEGQKAELDKFINEKTK